MYGEHQWKQGLEIEKGVAVERMSVDMFLLLLCEEFESHRD